MNQKFAKIIIFGVIVAVSFIHGLSSFTLAQEASGTLSFSPSTLSFASGETKSLAIVWTGPGIEAAKVVINVGPGLSIVEFKNPGEGISFLINSPEAGEVHLGKLTEGPIESGTTLFTMDVQAASCTQGGNIEFSSQSLVPEITLSFQNASYTCRQAQVTTAPGVTNLPKTAIISDEFDKYLFASILVSVSIGVLYLSKILKDDKTLDEIELITTT